VVALVSAVIVAVLVLQAVATFDLFPRLLGRPSSYFWPFLDYPMYRRAHYEGETIEVYRVVGLLEGGGETVIEPADLGLSFWKFRDGFVWAIRQRDGARLAVYAEHYRARAGRRLAALRLERAGHRVTRAGIEAVAPETLLTVDLGPREARAR
jgi:hypothetical protein